MGCGRSKLHSHTESETCHKTNGIEKDNSANLNKDTEFGNAKFRTRRCTPAINTNGALQQSNLSISGQEKGLEKFSAKSFNMKGLASTQVLRVTNSQLEFFKMLDEKIEQGGQLSSDEEDYLAETS